MTTTPAGPSPRQPRRWRLLLVVGAALMVGGCTATNRRLQQNPFISERSARNNSKILPSDVQRSYNQSLKNNYLAVIGSQLTRELIINTYIEFMLASRAAGSSDILQGNFASFGYFNAPSITSRREYCHSSNSYLGTVLVGSPSDKSLESLCRDKASNLRIQLGYSLRGFSVPLSNRFAQSLSLADLRRASQKPGGALWSDLDPAWPRRPIRWLFSSQADFINDLNALGIRPPGHYKLAAIYDSAYQNLGNHPDNLLLAPTSPGTTARLQGARFRILPVRRDRNTAALVPSAQTMAEYPAEMIKGLYLYLNTKSDEACIMMSFADFMIRYNNTLMNENDLIPLTPAQQRAALLVLQKQAQQIPLKTTSPALCRAYAQFTAP